MFEDDDFETRYEAEEDLADRQYWRQEDRAGRAPTIDEPMPARARRRIIAALGHQKRALHRELIKVSQQ